MPKGDREWQDLVNTFVISKRETELRDKWLGDYLPQALSDADYCLNKRKN